MVYPPLSLATTGFVAGLLLVFFYGFALWRPDAVNVWIKKFPRSRSQGVILLTVAAGWSFLMLRTMDLGEFSSLRRALLIAVVAGYALSLFYIDDFLSVRALGMVMLLLAEPMLESAFLKPQVSRLVLVVLAYALIVKGMFFVGMPYVFRDWVGWWIKSSARMRASLIGGLAYGVLLISLAATRYR